jgi:hypothetical protein
VTSPSRSWPNSRSSPARSPCRAARRGARPGKRRHPRGQPPGLARPDVPRGRRQRRRAADPHRARRRGPPRTVTDARGVVTATHPRPARPHPRRGQRRRGPTRQLLDGAGKPRRHARVEALTSPHHSPSRRSRSSRSTRPVTFTPNQYSKRDCAGVRVAEAEPRAPRPQRVNSSLRRRPSSGTS